MKQEVSNSTIAVLLVLTILVSVIGTWTVLEKTSKNAADKAAGMQAESSGDILTGSVVSEEMPEAEPMPEPEQVPEPEEDEKDKEDEEKENSEQIS